MSLTLPYRKSVIIDNNAINNLYELDALDIVFETFKSVSIPVFMLNGVLDDEVKKKLEVFDYKTCCIESVKSYEIYKRVGLEFKGLSTIDKRIISVSKEFDYYIGCDNGLIKKVCTSIDIPYISITEVIKVAISEDCIDEIRFKKLLTHITNDRVS